MRRLADTIAMAGYSLLLTVALLVSAPWWLMRMLGSGRYRAGLSERLGHVPPGLVDATQERRVVWVHAVSVGEVLAGTRLVAELEAALGAEWVIVVSTTTATGQALARERFGTGRVFYYPLDFAWAVRAHLRVLKPEMLVLMESELWPRMLVECGRQGIPVAVVNARVSDRSYARGLKVKAVWGRVLRRVDLFLAQSEEDGRRLVGIGARAEAVRAIGNLKYDVRAPGASRIADLIRVAAGGRPIVVAGSTVGGTPYREEELFFPAMQSVWGIQPAALLVLAPRHPERFDDVFSLACDYGVAIKATDLLKDGSPLKGANILLLNTVGDLAAVYGLANLSFVGGSLVQAGGHNPLEPARFCVPVVMGSSFENFREIVGSMLAADAVCIVKDQYECGNTLAGLLNTDRARAMGERGRAVFEAQSGATGRTVEALIGLEKR